MNLVLEQTQEKLNSVYPNHNAGSFCVLLPEIVNGALTFQITDLSGRIHTNETIQMNSNVLTWMVILLQAFTSIAFIMRQTKACMCSVWWWNDFEILPSMQG